MDPAHFLKGTFITVVRVCKYEQIMTYLPTTTATTTTTLLAMVVVVTAVVSY